MNELLIAVGVIFLICLIVGFARGFIKIVASLAVTIATIILVMFLSPYVSNIILEHTPLEKKVQEYCTGLLTSGEKETTSAEEFRKAEYTREEQISMIEGAELPDVFQKLLLDNNNSEIYKNLGVETFGDYACRYFAKLIADILGFLLTFLVLTIVARIVVYVLGFIGDLPIIGGFNRVAGGALGLVTGLIIVWVLFVAITLLYQTDFGMNCFKNIEESRILTFLYDNNILMKFIGK